MDSPLTRHQTKSLEFLFTSIGLAQALEERNLLFDVDLLNYFYSLEEHSFDTLVCQL